MPLRIGSRVETVRTVDHFPDICLAPGARGIITRMYAGGLFISLDTHYPALDHWNNVLQIEANDALSYVKEIAPHPLSLHNPRNNGREYTVTITRTVIETAQVTVYAENEDEAADYARLHASEYEFETLSDVDTDMTVEAEEA